MRYLALSMFSTSSLLFPEIERTVTFVTCAFVAALPIKSKVAKAKMKPQAKLYLQMFLAKADKLKDEKEKAKLTAKVKEQLKGM